MTRDLVREALAAAIRDLEAELDERHELTSDTQGVAGSPDIVATILAKIDAANAFVGDVTPIARSSAGKAVAYPNVLIELGYAKKSLGLSAVTLVWNTAFDGATIEQLPFDMRGRRAPMSFHLEPGASTADLRAVRTDLQGRLRVAVAASMAATAPAIVVEDRQELQRHDLVSPALWFRSDQDLTINEDSLPGLKKVNDSSLGYVRILPKTGDDRLILAITCLCSHVFLDRHQDTAGAPRKVASLSIRGA